MKREVSFSLVSKAGTISLTALESKGQWLVSTQTRPIGRAAIHSILSYVDIAERLLICLFLKPKRVSSVTIDKMKSEKKPLSFLYAYGKV